MAIALYEKFGFEVEGTHRRYAFRNGEYVDAYSMARLRGWLPSAHDFEASAPFGDSHPVLVWRRKAACRGTRRSAQGKGQREERRRQGSGGV